MEVKQQDQRRQPQLLQRLVLDNPNNKEELVQAEGVCQIQKQLLDSNVQVPTI